MATLLILGFGQGVGSSATKALAKSGQFKHIALCSRNAERLNAGAADVKKVEGEFEVHTFPTDLNDFDTIKKTIQDVKKLGDIQAVLYNAVRIDMSDPLEQDVTYLEQDFRTYTLALYVVAQELIPTLSELSSHSRKPAFIVTNSHLPEQPYSQVLSLSVSKAAQQNLVQNLAQAYGEKINFSVIKIHGTVGDEEGKISPDRIGAKIAEAYEFAARGKSSELLVKINP